MAENPAEALQITVHGEPQQVTTGTTAADLFQDDPTIVVARINDVLKDHPSVQGNLLVSYLGVPLVDDDGHSVGTLCVWDRQPRQWTTGHIQILQDLAWIIRERVFE